MQTYQQFKRLNIEHAVIGLDQSDLNTTYFCTPTGSIIVGNAGIAGIHYCFIQRFGDMVFAVSPEALPGEYVHPIARNFKELMELLLACGSMDAIEQSYMWDKELFEQYRMDNQPTAKQKAILDTIKETFHILPMAHPFEYMKELQDSFDYSKLVFSDEYYALLPDEEVTEIKAPEWKVTYEGGFYPKRGRTGKEIRVDQTFSWGNEIWHIPAAYVCTKGLVVDYLMEVEPEPVKAFVKKWHMFEAKEQPLSHEEHEQLREEHPLNIEFRSVISVNGADIGYKQGCGVYWIPKECLPDDVETELEAKWILEHYGFNLNKAWAVHRVSYPWSEKNQIKYRL